jgi:hypothetical protein
LCSNGYVLVGDKCPANTCQCCNRGDDHHPDPKGGGACLCGPAPKHP